MSKFTQNQLVQIGTKDNLPDGWNTPQPARVICIDCHALHDISVVVLAQSSPTSTFEQVRQFNSEGLCINAMIGEGNPNASQYLDSNLYPVEE